MTIRTTGRRRMGPDAVVTLRAAAGFLTSACVDHSEIINIAIKVFPRNTKTGGTLGRQFCISSYL